MFDSSCISDRVSVKSNEIFWVISFASGDEKKIIPAMIIAIMLKSSAHFITGNFARLGG